MANSTKSALLKKWRKWKRDHPEFPLTVNANGQWSKIIRGRTHYFGLLQNKDAALETWQREAPYLLAGKIPPRPGDRFTVGDLVEKWRADVAARLARGEISKSTAKAGRHTARFVEEHIGASTDIRLVGPEEFATLRARVAETGRNLRSQTDLIVRIRGMFRWGEDTDDGMGFYSRIRFGPRFKAPKADAVRKERESREEDRFLPAETVRAILEAAKARPAIHCVLLLGVNCAFYAADSIRLTIDRLHLDHDPPYHDFPRTKNGRPRKAVLWPETAAALRDYLQHRPDSDSRYVILNHFGRPYSDKAPGGSLWTAFSELLEDAGVTVGHWTSIGSLRHTYGTVVDLSADQQMIDLTMGHAPKSLQKRIYSQRHLTEFERLTELADVVHNWLFGDVEGDEEPDVISFADHKLA